MGAHWLRQDAGTRAARRTIESPQRRVECAVHGKGIVRMSALNAELIFNKIFEQFRCRVAKYTTSLIISGKTSKKNKLPLQVAV